LGWLLRNSPISQGQIIFWFDDATTHLKSAQWSLCRIDPGAVQAMNAINVQTVTHAGLYERVFSGEFLDNLRTGVLLFDADFDDALCFDLESLKYFP
jgi:hypothetical protein